MAEKKLDLMQGTVDVMVLQTLSAMGSQHGYGIARRIEQISGNQVMLNQVLVDFGSATRTDRVIEAVQRDGTCWMGGTVWKGRRCMRISASNAGTTLADVEASIDAIRRCL